MPGSENSTSVVFYYVYVIESLRNGKLYIGYTHNPSNRLQEHNRGLNFSTKPYTPWQIIHFEAYLHKEDAKRREFYLKTNQGSQLLKRMLKEYFYMRREI